MAEPIGALRVAISASAAQFEKDSAEIRSSVQRMEDRFQQMQARVTGSNKALSKEFEKLTNSSDFLASGIRRMRSAVEGIVWGSVIGAVSAVVSKTIEYAMSSKSATIVTEELNKSILDGSIKYGLLSKSQREVTATTVALFNAELELAQFRAVRDIADIKRKIEALREENRVKEEARRKNAELLESMAENHPLYLSTVFAFTKQSEVILQNNVEIEKLTGRERELNDIMQLKKVTLEQVAVATKNLTNAQLKQEALGRQILAQARQEATEKGLIQEGLGRQLLAQAQTQAEEQAAVQEAMGRFILDRARADAMERALIEEGKGRAILAAAQNEIKVNEFRVQSASDTASALASITEAIYLFGQQRSKALFNVVKAASLAEAVVNTYRAANQVLADPTLPAFAKGPAAAAVIAAGLANVARISATKFGGGASGGGGGAVDVASVPSTDRGLRGGDRLPPPLEVNVTIQGNVIGEDAFINERIIPGIEDAVRNERSKLALKDD